MRHDLSTELAGLAGLAMKCGAFKIEASPGSVASVVKGKKVGDGWSTGASFLL